jgi:alpha-beta hydrolase superfamily lysophospholipase
MAKIEISKLMSTSGANLYVHQCKAQGDAKGIVQINHGLSEHSARYLHFMEYLASKGYHSIAHDHRGHGQTEVNRLPKGQFAKHGGTSKVIKDVAFINQLIRDESPDLPIICFGHSLGGLIAANYAQTLPHTIHGLAIWNSNLKASQTTAFAQLILAVEAFFMGSDVPSAMVAKMTFKKWSQSIEGAKTRFDWLTHDQDMIEMMLNDRLNDWNPSISMWQDVMTFIANGAHPKSIGNLPLNLPINLVAGGQDPATENGAAMDWFANLLKKSGHLNVDYQVYKDFRHETLNEIGREQAMQDFVLWADKCVDTKIS